jgi:signal transduction histidine kinase
VDELLSRTFYVEWAIMAVSLFNTILPLWLGLTVLLNADRRTRIVWLAGTGLLSAGAFFICHSVILAYGMKDPSGAMDVWWHLGWAPVIVGPYAWYAVMLWYAGFWDHKYPYMLAHRIWLPLSGVLGLVVSVLMVVANPLFNYDQIARFNMGETPEVAGVPVVVVAYSAFIVLCMGLSLDALRRHPEGTRPLERVMGDLARRRARPWLVATSFVFLVVSLLVSGALFWIMLNVRQRTLSGIYSGMGSVVAIFDLGVAALIGVAMVLLGQAVVSYEIFTGKTLPRRGFLRHYRAAVALAAGYSMVAGWGLTLQVRPIYVLLPATALMTVFYALYSWRSYAERDRFIDHLRPFVASQGLHEQLLTRPSTPLPLGGAGSQFQALCEDVLGASLGYLVPVGPLAPLVGAGLTYPDASHDHQSASRILAASVANGSGASSTSVMPPVAELVPRFTSPQTVYAPLDPTRFGGAQWAVPLWSGSGLIGVLLLGEKRDGGLYTQEEIEIARASGERLIDTQAGAEMAQRLMSLQRQRLAESQVLDRRARRVLHDDVLPRLHTAMLAISSGRPPTPSGPLELLADVHRQISNLLLEMPTAAAPEVSRLGLIAALQRAVDDELAGAFDKVEWQVEPEAAERARKIPSLTGEVLFYAAREAIRNAAKHARKVDPSQPLHLRIAVLWRDGLDILVEDNGVGLGAEGHSNGGSGQGLALHSTMMAVVGGSLAAESVPGSYTRVSLTLPQGSW